MLHIEVITASRILYHVILKIVSAKTCAVPREPYSRSACDVVVQAVVTKSSLQNHAGFLAG